MIVDFNDIGKACVKTLLLILNGCCIFISILAITFTILDSSILKQYDDKAISVSVGNFIIIAAALLLMGIAGFGSAGAIKGNAKALYTYIGLLMIMIVIEMMIGIYVSIQRYGLEFRLSEWLREDFFRNVTELGDRDHKNILWDSLQATYECCGLNGPEDYIAMQQQISVSCCQRAYRAKNAFARDQLYRYCIKATGYYNVGCEDEILRLLKSERDWLIGVIVACFWFEAVGMLLAMWVAKHATDKSYTYKKTVKY